MPRRFSLAALVSLLALRPGMALAHGGEHAIEGPLWQQWSADPAIVGLAALAAWLYLRGARMRRTSREGISPGRQVAFLAGLALVVLALQSPVDAMAEHLFWMHQVQHMLLRVLGPLLMLGAMPQGAIFAGMPKGLRRLLVLPAARSRKLRALGRWLVRPAPATGLFIAAIYVWEIPALHNAALLNEPLHYFMHVTMLAAGIGFFWVIFDRRDPPKAVSHRTRVVMLIAALLSEILIGAATTLKPMILYPAYDAMGRLFGMAPLSDEMAGGFLIWQPTSMMFLLTLLLLLGRWNGAEERGWRRSSQLARSNSAALLVPETAEELWMVVEDKNRRLAYGLALIPVALFLIVFGTMETLLFL